MFVVAARPSAARSLLSCSAAGLHPRPPPCPATCPRLAARAFHRTVPPSSPPSSFASNSRNWEHRPHPLWQTATSPAARDATAETPPTTSTTPTTPTTSTTSTPTPSTTASATTTTTATRGTEGQAFEEQQFRKAAQFAERAALAAEKAHCDAEAASPQAQRRMRRAAIRAREHAQRAADKASRLSGPGLGLDLPAVVKAMRKAERAARQLTSLRSAKAGDLLLLKSGQPKLMHLITRVDEPADDDVAGTRVIYTTKPPYSAQLRPGTWSLEGRRAFYTPTAESDGLTDALRSKIRALPADAWGSIAPHAQGLRNFLYRDKCPWAGCKDGMIDPRYKGPEFAELRVALDADDGSGSGSGSNGDSDSDGKGEKGRQQFGMAVTCPVCLGYEFAESDLAFLRELCVKFAAHNREASGAKLFACQSVKALKGEEKKQRKAERHQKLKAVSARRVALMKEWQDRLDRIDHRRHEMALPSLKWSNYDRAASRWLTSVT